MNRAIAAAGVAVATLGATGCATGTGSGETATATVTETVTTTAEPSASESSAVQPPSESTSTIPWTLGEFASNQYQKTRAIAVEKGQSQYSQLPPDQQWWKVQVETCALDDLQGQTVTTGWSPWGIQGDDGGSYPASNSTWSDFPKPQYPFAGNPIPVGQCRKGWVMVAVNQGVEPAFVTYSTRGVSGTRWTVQE